LKLKNDIETVMETFHLLGIAKEDTIILYDADYDEVVYYYDKIIKERYKDAERTNTNTIFFLWYAGHSVYGP